MFGPRSNEATEDPRIMLKHVWEAVEESLASFIAYFGECAVGRGCKWVVWPLILCCTLPVLTCSEALGVKPGLDTLIVLVGVARCAG